MHYENGARNIICPLIAEIGGNSMKYNKDNKYAILEGKDENLAIDVSDLDLSFSKTAGMVDTSNLSLLFYFT